MFALIAIVFGSLLLMFVCMFSYMCNERRIVGVGVWVFMVISFSALLIACTSNSSVVSSNAERIVRIDYECVGERGYLYQEPDTGKYFIIASSTWDIAHPSYRHYIDSDVVEEYLENYEQFEENWLIR